MEPIRTVLALAWITLAGVISATPVPIADFSFEENFLVSGDWTNGIGPEWSETDGPNSSNGFEEWIPGFAAHGTDHLGMNSGHDVWQDLALTYQPNTIYTLTIAAGHRPGSTVTGNQTTYALADLTGTVHASRVLDATPIAPGSFAEAPALVFDTSNSPQAVGQPIRILLRARGSGRSHFDHIRLDATPVVPPGSAWIINLPADQIATNGATLRGEVLDPAAGAPEITFHYGMVDGGLDPAAWEHSLTLPGNHTGTYEAAIAGLQPATLYYFSARSSNTAGQSWALPARSFETLALPATAANLAATDIGASTATVGATILDNGGDNPTVTIFYGSTDGGSDPGAWEHSLSLGVVTSERAIPVTGLDQETTYFFRARTSNSGGEAWAPASASFTTEAVTLPAIKLKSPNGLTGSTASLRGEVTDDGHDPPMVTIFYGFTDEGPTEDWDHSVTIGAQSGDFNQFVSGLLPETWYFFTVRAVNSAGTTWVSPPISFRTTSTIPNSAIINEIHFDPEDETSPEEFVELHNPGDSPIDLSGWQLGEAIQYTIPAGTTIGVGGYLVIAQDPATIEAVYGVPALGPWTGRLANEGERIELRNRLGILADQVEYGVGFPWPTGSRGNGGSAELIHPSLDNNLGGSWRTSGSSSRSSAPTSFIPAGSTGWSYRKGTSEASDPDDAWRYPTFEADGSWRTGTAPIGYGDGDDATELADMQGNYWSVYFRHEFTLDPLQVPSRVLLRLYVDDGCVVWLNGNEVWRAHVPGGQLAFNASANNHEARWEELVLDNAGAILSGGSNVLAIHALNSRLDSSDFSLDAELRTPTPGSIKGVPTPGLPNSSLSPDVPPQIRQVSHSPANPGSDDPVLITAKITDPDGVGRVTLDYQVVQPGAYIRRSDPEYLASWTSVAMLDDGQGSDLVAGDFTFSALLPPSASQHRNLVRYRITFEDLLGNRATVPYPDDQQANFAYFVYDRLPAWSGSFTPGGPVRVFPSSLLDDLPVYHLIANDTDVDNSQYDGEYDGVHMLGTLVYDGIVYDHIEFENRGEGSTYVSGKNKWRIHFNRARSFEGRDDWGRPYASPWNRMNFNGCASPWAAVNRGMAGLDEALNYRLYALAGVPSPRTNYFHFRVIDQAEESTPGNQFEGDLWGLYLAIEHPDGSFLNDRDLPDGNVYKIEGGNGDKKEQGATQPLDSSDWAAFYSFSDDAHTAAEWRERMHMPTYYSFRGINRLNGNVDLRLGYNHYFYHHPDGRWRVMPWDLDMMWIAETHQGGTIRQQNCLEAPELAIEFRNRCRELLDLLCEDPDPAGGQLGQLIDEYADLVNPSSLGLTWADLDACLWNHHPRTNGNPANHGGQTSHKGNFFQTPFTDSRRGGTWTRTLATPDFEGFVQYLLDYTFDTFPGGSWSPGNGIPDGYGYEFLAYEAKDPAIPHRPTITSVGSEGYPIDDLRFQSGTFSNPLGGGSFRAVKWRIAEIAAPGRGAHLPGTPRLYEVEPLWESEELPSWGDPVQIPIGLAKPGHTYRVRVRHGDDTGRWSHWSTPLEFTAGAPTATPWRNNLMITELMYNPVAPTGAESLVTLDNDDFEFIELKNISTTLSLDLSNISFTDGVRFDFATGSILSLAPGEIVLVVKNRDAFEARYGLGLPVAGEFLDSNLTNSGERVVLSYANAITLHDFFYLDDPPWPTGPDGSGPSLTLINPEGAPDHALASNWTASSEAQGSPGADAATCETIEAWKNAHFSVPQLANPELSGDLKDPDHDGLSNLIEYALDTHPAAPTRAEDVLTPVVEVVDEVAYLALRFRRRICHDHLTYHVEVGSDLVTWLDGDGHTSMVGQPLPNGDGTETVTIRSTIPLANRPAEFIRLRVSYAAP